MEGIYLKTKYTLFLSLILFKNKNGIIYFINEELKNEINLKKRVIWLKNFGTKRSIAEKI